MSWNEVLIQVIEGIVGLAISAAGVYVSIWIKSKVKNDKLQKTLNEVNMLTLTCVTMIKQTFVDSMKKQGKFDKEAQVEAFNKCFEEITNMVSEESKKIIIEQYGNFEQYITALIESKVATTKNNKEE